jgi:3-oxoacyl-[acyl-carrier-protein] synthase-3
MTYQSVGIRAIAMTCPSIKRTNDFYREKYPELIAQSEQKSLAKLFSLTNSMPSNEMAV